MSTRLLPCLLGAVALHAAALGWLAHGASRPGGEGGPVDGTQPARQRAAPMQVALRAPRGGQADEGQGAQAVRQPPEQTATQPPTPAAPGRDDEAAASPDPALQGPAGAPRGGADAEGYVPRPLLTTAPEPTRDIALPFPLDFTARGRFAGILTLYIEADGRVSRVVVEGASLPAPLARAAQQAFTSTRFTPGRVAQRIVKSRIRVEVVFEHPSA